MTNRPGIADMANGRSQVMVMNDHTDHHNDRHNDLS